VTPSNPFAFSCCSFGQSLVCFTIRRQCGISCFSREFTDVGRHGGCAARSFSWGLLFFPLSFCCSTFNALSRCFAPPLFLSLLWQAMTIAGVRTFLPLSASTIFESFFPRPSPTPPPFPVFFSVFSFFPSLPFYSWFPIGAPYPTSLSFLSDCFLLCVSSRTHPQLFL